MNYRNSREIIHPKPIKLHGIIGGLINRSREMEPANQSAPRGGINQSEEDAESRSRNLGVRLNVSCMQLNPDKLIYTAITISV